MNSFSVLCFAFDPYMVIMKTFPPSKAFDLVLSSVTSGSTGSQIISLPCAGRVRWQFLIILVLHCSSDRPKHNHCKWNINLLNKCCTILILSYNVFNSSGMNFDLYQDSVSRRNKLSGITTNMGYAYICNMIMINNVKNKIFASIYGEKKSIYKHRFCLKTHTLILKSRVGPNIRQPNKPLL